MVLPEQLAVQDLVALGRFLLLPEDDLTLAALLKGPLFGLAEEQLFDLAWQRQGSLWRRLRERAAGDLFLAPVEAELAALLARADFTPPFELFAGLLAGGQGRRRILTRLGPEAGDPLDEFLAQALAYEEEHPPSLEGFLHWLEQGRLVVKRDLEAAGGAIRVMTVHGAKGLEAPVVFLPDTTTEGGQPTFLLVDRPGEMLVPQVAGWREVTELQPARARDVAATQEESRRLLYVALTRAADRLYLCGWKARAGQDASWHQLLSAGFAPLAERHEVEGLGEVHRLVSPQEAPPVPDERALRRGRAVNLAPWRTAAAPPEPRPPRPLTPSRPSGPEQPALSPLAAAAGDRFRRGLVIHRLLQSLPELPAERRAAAGRRFLSMAGQDLVPETREAWLAETLAVMDLPEAAPLFQPGSRAEVALSGRVGELLIAGQADRLAITPEAVLLVDYKTNRPPPQQESEVSEAYWRQMAAYRALLRQLYPGRPVRCFLLWTDGPRLMQLSDEGLAARLP
jgi:ATP-dependent helicase/nuclease subunit A